MAAEDGIVIDPVARHINSCGDAGPVMARACAVFQTGAWRRRWRQAQEDEDYSTMDRLDREWEMIGLP